MICCTVHIFHYINVQAFGLFCVVVVYHPEQPDWWLIIGKAVEFGNIKMLPNSQIDKDHLVIVKHSKAVMQPTNGLTCMRCELCKVKEVEEPVHHFHHVWWIYCTREREVNNEPKKDHAHPLVLLAWYSRKCGNPLGKQHSVVTRWHGFAPYIDCYCAIDLD